MSNTGKRYEKPVSLWPLELEDALWGLLKTSDKLTAQDQIKREIIGVKTIAYKEGYTAAISAVETAAKVKGEAA